MDVGSLTTVAETAGEAVDVSDVAETYEGGDGGEGTALPEGAETFETGAPDIGTAESLAQLEGWSLDPMLDAADGLLVPESVELQVGNVTEQVSPAEAEIYQEAGLRGEMVEGRGCLVRDDIDLGAVDHWGQTNLERMEQGFAPLDPDGKPYELHHVQQEDQGLLAELTRAEHRGEGNDGILHDRKGPSEIDREAFEEVRADHWRARAAELGGAV
jgi:hypothetical protein